MKTLFLVSLSALLAGCSVSVDEQCRTWQTQGEIFSSMQNCVACGNSLGIEDLHAVRACTFKRDADSILKR